MTASPIVFFIDPDEAIATAVRKAAPASGLQFIGAEASLAGARAALSSTPPDATVLDAAACDDLVMGVRKVLATAPATCLIVTGNATPPATMSRAVAAGARGFLLKPYTPADLLATITEALDTSRIVAAAAAGAATPVRKGRGRMIAVYSPKGGVGSTTIATNLAVAIASRPGKSVALVDLDLQFGDVGAALDLRSANSIAEVLSAEEISPELIRETFVRHDSGIQALLAPDDLSVVDAIDPHQVLDLLERLREHFDYVVCDLWSSLDELTRGVMTKADRILMVTTPEYPALRDVQRVLKSIRVDMSIDDRMLIVLNRYPGKVGLRSAEIAKVLAHRIAAAIPSEGASVTDAINRGLSLLDARARVRIAGHYRELAALVVDQPNAKAAGRAAENRVPLAR